MKRMMGSQYGARFLNCRVVNVDADDKGLEVDAGACTKYKCGWRRVVKDLTAPV